MKQAQKHTGGIQEAPKGTKRKRKYNTSPHLAPSQSKKPSKESGPSFTTDLDHTQRLQTKEFFNLFIDSSSLSKAILFLSFHTAQKIHEGVAFHTFLRFLPILKPLHPLRVSLTE